MRSLLLVFFLLGIEVAPSLEYDDAEPIGNKLSDATERTVEFFAAHIDHEGYFNATGAEADICYMYKTPLALLFGGRLREANRMIDYIKEHFLLPNGDIRTSEESKTCNPTLNEYYTFTNGWIVLAAQNMERFDVSFPMYNYLKRYFDGFPTQGPSDEGYSETDIFITAHLGRIALNMGDLPVAKKAAKAILKNLEKQPDLDNGYYLRSDNGEPIIKTGPYYFLSKTEPDQLHFFLGYPSLFLSRMYEATGKKIYLKKAELFVDYGLSCHKSVYTNHWSHKLAVAASNLARITHKSKYTKAAKRIAFYLLSLENEDGTFLDPDVFSVKDIYEQSAEMFFWLRDIDANIFYMD